MRCVGLKPIVYPGQACCKTAMSSSFFALFLFVFQNKQSHGTDELRLCWDQSTSQRSHLSSKTGHLHKCGVCRESNTRRKCIQDCCRLQLHQLQCRPHTLSRKSLAYLASIGKSSRPASLFFGHQHSNAVKGLTWKSSKSVHLLQHVASLFGPTSKLSTSYMIWCGINLQTLQQLAAMQGCKTAVSLDVLGHGTIFRQCSGASLWPQLARRIWCTSWQWKT